MNAQQPKVSKVETLTTTVGIDGDDGTRALEISSDNKNLVKTFAAGEQIAVIYQNTSGNTVKAVSEKLVTADITDDGKSAQFTVTLTDADKSKNVTYIYPAAMAGNAGVDYSPLASQDGTLTTLASSLDYCDCTGAWNGEQLPAGKLDNKLAIVAFTLKDALGSSDITSTITSLTVSEGTNNYTVTRTAAKGPIYVAMKPTSSATINFFAKAGTTASYAKYVENKTYAAGNMYQQGLKMAEVISGKFSVSATKKVYFSVSNLNATTTNNGSTWSWHFVAEQYYRVGNAVANTTINGDGTVNNNGNGGNVDLFGWSTSNTHLGIHNSTDNNVYSGDFADWGSASEVTACIGTGWFTLSSDEWRYLTVTRSGNRFAMALLNETRGGMILLPDDWKTSYYSLKNINDDKVAFTTNKITYAQWATLEEHGAVFLPVTGQRNSGTTINGADEQLHYWSSTKGNTGANANHLRWMPSGTSAGLAPDTGAGRCNGFAVRLVYPVK